MTADAGFENEIKRSLPKKTLPGRPIWSWKIPSPATWRQDHGKGDEGKGFSPKMPFDFLVVAEAITPLTWVGIEHHNHPTVTFALECKHTFGQIAKAPKSRAGKLHATLPFSRVSKEQVKGLSEAGAAGVVAGIIWLVELSADSPDFNELAEGSTVRDLCWFIPVAAWTRYIELMAGTDVRSLGLHEVADLGVRRLTAPAIEIHEDVGRGTANRYWEMGKFMRHFGADAGDK